jgi:membrane-associated protease RseP (regulator of RpoE activity)
LLFISSKNYTKTKGEGLSMEPIAAIRSTKKYAYALAGLGGISLVILIHEVGHFLFAHIFNVPTPVFSIGFGPTLYAFSLGNTIFKIALLPFGGYVQMDEQILAQQQYIPKMLIVFGGILFNFIFAYGVMWCYKSSSNENESPTPIRSKLKDMSQTVAELMVKKDNSSGIIGPIGIISMIGKSLEVNRQLYWFILALLSLNMGLFNMIPLPFFDGGLALRFTIEAVIGRALAPNIVWLVSAAFLVLFVAFIMHVTMNDIKGLKGNE